MTLLPDRRYAPEHLGRVLVLGRGVTGKAVLDYLMPLVGTRVDSVTVAEGDDVIEGTYDLCVASPGISQFSDIYQAARAASTELIGEIELAWRESASDARWIAITGTNGKTTTTALCAHIMEECGCRVRCVGNIGDAAITAVADESGLSVCKGRGAVPIEIPHEPKAPVALSCEPGLTESGAAPRPLEDTVYVVECSSYQLASTVRFAPDVAVVLNITPDHLAWHRSHENYAEAKWRILANLAESQGVAVLNAADDEVRAKVRALKADPQREFAYIPLGTAAGIQGDMRTACGAENAAFLNTEGSLEVAFAGVEAVLCKANTLQIAGMHNVENALAAASAAIAAGASADRVGHALATFAPLPHRIEPVGTVSGIRFYNDSKATNTDATLKALTAFLPEKPLVLLGGRDKGTDLEPLVDACIASSAGVILYGESLPRFAAAFARVTEVPVMQETGMADAFARALAASRPGGIVLLSPACASFDEFSCFEERGERFKQLVEDARCELGE